VRGDLIALSAVGESRAAFVAIVGAASFSGLLADTGLSPAQIRERSSVTNDEIVYRRAHDCGELDLDLDRVPPAVLAMPFDLERQDPLLNLAPVRRARIESIVDELFLPLVAAPEPQAPRRVSSADEGRL
jgi:hypothetical protein